MVQFLYPCRKQTYILQELGCNWYNQKSLDNENDILDFGKFQKKFSNLKAHYLDFIRIISLIKKTAKSVTTTIRQETRTK